MKLLPATAAVVWTTTTAAAAAAAGTVSAFSIAPPPSLGIVRDGRRGCPTTLSSSSIGILLRSTPSDDATSTLDSEDEDDRDFDTATASPASVAASSTSSLEYAALAPGDVDSLVRIRIGDPSRARKAWKKRRRSGSPLLVPASIIDVDRTRMVRRNVVHLLHKYGEDMAGVDGKYDDVGGGSGGGDGVALTVKKAAKLYERDLGGSLMNHARALNHPTVGSLLLTLFDDPYRRETGIELIRNRRENLLLVSSLSLRRARDVASKSALVQFDVPDLPATTTTTSEEGSEEEEEADREDDAARSEALSTSSSISVPHTGAVKIRLSDSPHDATNVESKSKKPKPRFVDASLSAAVRISRRDVDHGRVRSGLEMKAFAFGYDPAGDDGSPLLTLTIDRPRGWVRESMKRKARSRREEARRDEKVRIWKRATETAGGTAEAEETTTAATTVSLNELKAGDGPLQGTVVRLSSRAGAAFLDCGVSRKAGKKRGGGTVRSLGMLRFDDLVRSMTTPTTDGAAEGSKEEEADVIEAAMDLEEDDEEEEEEEDTTTEDVTDLFELTEDGFLSVVDEGTGERTVLANPNDDEEENIDDDDEEEDDDDIDAFAKMSPEERLAEIGRMLEAEEEEEDEEAPDDEEFFYDEEEEEEESSSSSAAGDYAEPTFLRTGDVVNVYVKAVYPQSGRYALTLDPPPPQTSSSTSSSKRKKAKDAKKEREAAKRLERLSAKYGDGRGSLEKLSEFWGVECEGIVKAASKTAASGAGGRRWYVRPVVEGADDLPVGVATAESSAEDDDNSELSSSHRSIREGDRVLVRLEGIDEGRGQIAMTLLKKI